MVQWVTTVPPEIVPHEICGWMEECREGVRNVLKVSELNDRVKERAYQESLCEKYEVWRYGEVETVEKEWENFRDIVMECTNDECGMRRVDGQRRKGSDWWNEDVGSAIKVKSSMARSLPVENLLPQNVRSIINYLQ